MATAAATFDDRVSPLHIQSGVVKGCLCSRSLVVGHRWKPLLWALVVIGALGVLFGLSQVASYFHWWSLDSLINLPYITVVTVIGTLCIVTGALLLRKMPTRVSIGMVSSRMGGYIDKQSLHNLNQELKNIFLRDGTPIPIAVGDVSIQFKLFNGPSRLLDKRLNLPVSLFKVSRDGDVFSLWYEGELLELTIDQPGVLEISFEEALRASEIYRKGECSPDKPVFAPYKELDPYKLGQKGTIYKLVANENLFVFNISDRQALQPKGSDAILVRGSCWKLDERNLIQIEFPQFDTEDLPNFDIIVNEKYLIVYGKKKTPYDTIKEKYFILEWTKLSMFEENDLKTMKKLILSSAAFIKDGLLHFYIPKKLQKSL